MKDIFIAKAKELLALKNQIKVLEYKESMLIEHLKTLCNNETVTHDGYTFLKINRVGSVKYDLVPELKNVNLDQYRGDKITSWKLSYEAWKEQM